VDVWEKIKEAQGLEAHFVGECDSGLLFRVESDDTVCHVVISDRLVQCDCVDYQEEWYTAEGSLLCVHVWAVLYLLLGLNGGGAVEV